jgi:predicted nucleic acid-binding protein
VKQNATLDSSFWINATAAGLVDSLLSDFDLCVPPDVARELTDAYPSGAHLHKLIEDQRIRVLLPTASALERFGPGEQATISLAAEHRGWTLLLDDLRPFRAAQEMGLSPVCTPAYAASLYQRGILDDGAVLAALARLAARSTVSPELLALALRQVAITLRERR